MTRPLRHIRLKESDRLACQEVTPTDEQIEHSNGTLLKLPYRKTTDEDGFITFPERRGAARIAFIGDSVIENMFVPEGRRLCDVATQKLANHGAGCQVLNGGQSGMSMLHAFNVLINKIIPLGVDGVIIGTGIIDGFVSRTAGGPWANTAYVSPFAVSDPCDYAPKVERAEPEFGDTVRIARLICAVSREFALPIAFATNHVNARRSGSDLLSEASYRQLVEQADQMNTILRDVGRANNVPVFDLAAALSGRADINYDLHHMNEHGASVAGTLLATFIASTFCSSAAPV